MLSPFSIDILINCLHWSSSRFLKSMKGSGNLVLTIQNLRSFRKSSIYKGL